MFVQNSESLGKLYVIKTKFFILAFTRYPLPCFEGRKGCQMEKLKPEKVVEMLKAKGTEVSIEQATVILKFLRKLADIVVSQYLGNGRNGGR